jgi:hypothetical protein
MRVVSCGSLHMRTVFAVVLSLFATAFLDARGTARAQACNDDYISVETIAGKILAIDLAPDPFQSADIFIAGPQPCTRLWMQVLKKDAVNCRIGDRIEAKGIITSDPDNHAWQINPERNDYMLLGADYICMR